MILMLKRIRKKSIARAIKARTDEIIKVKNYYQTNIINSQQYHAALIEIEKIYQNTIIDTNKTFIKEKQKEDDAAAKKRSDDTTKLYADLLQQQEEDLLKWYQKGTIDESSVSRSTYH